MRITHLVRRGVAALAAVGLLSAAASAAVIWDESVSGDLSNDRLNPNIFALAPGVNSLVATTGNEDREFVRIDVPAGLELAQLILSAYSGEDEIAFIGVQAGTTMTVDPENPDPSQLLGWALFGKGVGGIGADILDDIGMGGLGAPGFTPPLASGSYTWWIQQTGPEATYQLDFVVTPEPGSLLMLALAGLLRPRR